MAWATLATYVRDQDTSVPAPGAEIATRDALTLPRYGSMHSGSWSKMSCFFEEPIKTRGEKDVTMGGCNDSIPEERQGKIRSVMRWLWATAVAWWSWGIYLIHGVQVLQRRILVFLHRYWLPLLGGLTLLLAIWIQYALPQWYVFGIWFLQANFLVVGTVVLLLFFLFVWKVPKWQVAHITDEKDRLATEAEFRQTFVQIIGGAALFGGLYFTAQTLRTSQETLRVNQKTLETTQQGQITERFTKAIEHLGDKERLMVRLGGIYALERIARDSAKDHWQIMEVLTAYVRSNAPWQPKDAPPLKDDPGITAQQRGWSKRPFAVDTVPFVKPATDIQAVLTALGRRIRAPEKEENQQLDLHHTDLQGADLRDVHLARANLQGANLRGASLQGAHLEAANLQRASLQNASLGRSSVFGAPAPPGVYYESFYQEGAHLARANLHEADLTGADLRGADLRKAGLHGANLTGAQLAGADLIGADLWGARLAGADLTTVRGLTQDQVDIACVDEDTKLPGGLIKPPPCPTNP